MYPYTQPNDLSVYKIYHQSRILSSTPTQFISHTFHPILNCPRKEASKLTLSSILTPLIFKQNELDYLSTTLFAAFCPAILPEVSAQP